MKIFIGFLLGIAILTGAFYLFNKYVYQGQQGEIETQTTMKPTVSIIPVEHASAIIDWDGTALYTDPTGGAEKYIGKAAPAVVLITDIHGDHLSTSTLSAVKQNGVVVVPQAVQELLPPELSAQTVVMKNGDSTVQAGFTITAVPMYNVPEATSSFHTKGRGNGYIVEKDGFRVYIAGDTGPTPEMKALTDIDMALVPMNLPYTMSVEDAAQAVLAFKPKQVYPYHYRGQEGLSDVNKFKQLVSEVNPDIQVLLLNWYPTQS